MKEKNHLFSIYLARIIINIQKIKNKKSVKKYINL